MTGNHQTAQRSRVLLWQLAAVGLLGLIAGANGCAPRYHDLGAFVTTPRPLVHNEHYILEPPDGIAITSKRVREINNHRETIRPDGKITLPLLGSIYVAGKTVEQVSVELESMAKDYYEDADVSVRVVDFRSKKIFVFGEVQAAGPLPYDGNNTVLSTLAIAQPTRLADPERILILRPSPDGELIRRMTVDLDRMIKGGDTTRDALLKHGDIVYVPANGLAKVGLALQQVLLPIQPAAEVVNGPANIEKTVRGTTYGRGAGQ